MVTVSGVSRVEGFVNRRVQCEHVQEAKKVSAIGIVLYIVIHAAVSVLLALQQQTWLKQVQRGNCFDREKERETGTGWR